MIAGAQMAATIEDERRWLRWRGKPWVLAVEALELTLHQDQIEMLKILRDPPAPRLMIEKPPGVGKTMAIRVHLLSRILDDQNYRGIFGSVKEAGAARTVRWVGNQLKNNKIIRSVYGDLCSLPWSDTQITVTRTNHLLADATLAGVGRDTNTEGMRCDEATLDDPIDWTSMWSATERDRSTEYVDSTLLRRVDTKDHNRLDPRGRSNIVGGAWDPEDMYVHLVDKREFHLIRMPARTPEGAPTFPYSLPEEECARLEREDPFIWRLKYMLDREAQRGGWKWKWIEKYWAEITDLPPAEEAMTYIGIDPALSPDGDYFALAVLTVDEAGIIFLKDGWVGHLDAPAQLDLIIQKAHDLAAVTVGIEAVQYQTSLQQHIVARAPDVNAVPIPVGRGSKQIRLNTLASLFESGRLRVLKTLPGVDDELGGQSFRDEFRKEYVAFPRGKHDDVLDAILIAWKSIEGGFSVGKVDLDGRGR